MKNTEYRSQADAEKVLCGRGPERTSGDLAATTPGTSRACCASKPAQRYEISDNRNVYLAEIETARKEHVVFRTLEKLPTHPRPRALIVLCAALIKFDHFEWMIEKATELGVAEIVPVETARSERGLERAAHKRVERWRRIALEASQQSRRAFLPEVDEPVAFSEALARARRRIDYALDENPGAPPLTTRAARRRATSDDTVAMLIGPEGGWTDDERAAFTEPARVDAGFAGPADSCARKPRRSPRLRVSRVAAFALARAPSLH